MNGTTASYRMPAARRMMTTTRTMMRMATAVSRLMAAVPTRARPVAGMRAAKGIHITLDLTQREADELLRRVHDEGRHTYVHPDLREAWHKLREALDHSTRG